MKARHLAAAALLALASGSASMVNANPGPDTFDLVCAPDDKLAQSYPWDPVTKQYRPAADDAAARADFDSVLIVFLETDAGAIHLPAFLLTGPYTGDHDGWWTLEQFRRGPAEIRGRYRLSSTRQPEIVISLADNRFRLTDPNGLVEGRCMKVAGRTDSGL